MEKGKFEDSVHEAFRNAEVSPSEDSWTNISLELEKANGAQLKRRVFVYKMLAAASVIFIMGLSFGMYVINDRNADLADQLALLQKQNAQQLEANESLEQPERVSRDAMSSQITNVDKTAADDQSSNLRLKPGNEINRQSLASGVGSNNEQQLEKVNVSSIDERIVTDNSVALTSYSDADLPALYHPSKPQITARQTNANVDPVVLMMARLNDREKEIQKKSDEEKAKEKQQSEKLWTSVGLAAGSFNSAASSGVTSRTESNAFIAQNNSVADKEASANGIAYSVGVSLGAKISERWVLQGGVNYLTQSSDYTVQNAVTSSDFTTFRPASINELGKMNLATADAVDDEKLVSTAPYNVNNSLRYLSIPLQAGYLIINRAFGLQLNAGIATDLFLQNTVAADEGNLKTTTQESGEDSPYRAVNFSGLMGTELSYRFANHYRVALNPGIRYPLNTIYKSEIGVDSTPITFDLGLRFRYIF